MWFSFQYSLTETRRDSRCARGKNGGGGGGGYACWMNDCVVTTSRHCRSTVAAWHGSSCATLSSLSPKTPTERCGRREVSSRKPSDVGLSPFLSHFSDTCLFLAVFGRIHCVPHSADFHVDGDRHQAVGRRTPFLAGGRPRSLPVKFFPSTHLRWPYTLAYEHTKQENLAWCACLRQKHFGRASYTVFQRQPTLKVCLCFTRQVTVAQGKTFNGRL